MKQPITLEPQETESRPKLPADLDLDNGNTGGSKSYWWVWLLIFAAIGYGCYRLYLMETAKGQQTAAKREMMRKPQSLPVVASNAVSGNLPVYLRALGTVTAFNTVTVKPQVDGPLDQVLFHEGQYVHKGDLLAEIDPRPFQVALQQAEGNLTKDEAVLKDAQAIYARDQELYNAQIIAKQQLDTQAATQSEARAAIAVDQAAVNNTKLQLSYTRIIAPISGRIGLRQVDAGNIVHASDPNGIAIITQLQPISVLFSIPQEQLPAVLAKLRQGAKLRVDAYNQDESVKLATGTLLTVDNQIDATTGTSKLKAVFDNTDNKLFPNQFVNVKLWLNTERNVTIVPAVAIQRGPTGTFVYLVQSDNTVTVRPVKVGLSEGNEVSIDDGLKPGDSVVVDGAEKLTEGMKVSTRPARPENLKRRSQG
ncbi:MAG TPA: MdtA/MuxA family multidrug efflux RND transporter periplasmic adaptor subunit [Bryobacteraceae bacterium]|nr:MdtA/MuxA family multidrug efflux RND transporter periplasmic adaptor subunit [Bryobacteraceae bacterium]